MATFKTAMYTCLFLSFSINNMNKVLQKIFSRNAMFVRVCDIKKMLNVYDIISLILLNFFY